MKPLRLCVVLTHPVQYYAPWFRHIAMSRPDDIDLTVLYATRPLASQQSVGFGGAFAWDVPLLEGYRSVVLRPATSETDVHSDSFWGADAPEVGAAILEQRPDAVLVMGWYSSTYWRAIWTALRHGIPLLYHGDTNLMSAPSGWRRPLWAIKTRFLLSRFDAFLSVGRRAGAFLRFFGATDDRIFAAPHAVDNDFFAKARARRAKNKPELRRRFGLSADRFVVLFVGKLESKKRLADLLKAAAMMTPAPELLIVGRGPLEASSQQEAVRLGLDVRWAGFLNQTAVVDAYAAADCLALPSDGRETWGLVVNEALAAGLPCVVSNAAGAAPDMVGDGLAGAVVPVGDVSALAAALDSVRQRLSSGEDFERVCAARAASASFAAAAEGLAAACRAVTASDASPPPATVRTIVCCSGMVLAGGLERMTFEVLRALRLRGAAVHCVVNDWENHRIVALADEVGASWSTGRYQVAIARTLNPIRVAAIAWDVLRASAGLVRDARRFRATHVLLPDYVSALHNAPAIALLRAMGVKIVMRLGNAPEPGRFYRFVWRAIVDPLTAQFVPNSNFTERAVLAHGVPARKVRRIYNPVATRSRAAEAAPAQHEIGRLIFVGQMIPEKGVDVLLDAVALLVSRGYGHVRLDLVGDLDGWGPAYTGYREQLRARAQQADLAQHVRFLGWREDVPALLAAASIHCCPSMPAMRESFANVVVEAKAAGIPSVVFPTGSLAELVDHRVDGWVCDACTAASLADGLEFFLSDEPRREAAGRQARRSIDRFGWDQFATAWWSVFAAPQAAPELTPTTHPGASSA